MHFQPILAVNAPLAARGMAAHAWARWLLVLLLMFDLVGAPWHAHHHDSGIDGLAVATAVHAEAHASAAHVHAPDERPSWVHATTALRMEAGPALNAADDTAFAPASVWPSARLVPQAGVLFRPLTVSQHVPPTPADLRLPHSPQAPPWRA